MAFLLDGLVIIIFLLSIYLGYKRGFVKTVIRVVGCFLALLIASSLSQPLAESIFDVFMAEKIESTVSQQIQFTDEQSVEKSLDSVLGDLPSPVTNALSQYNMGTPQQITSKLSGSLNTTTENITKSIVQNVIRPVAVSLLRILCFIILFVLLMILVAIAGKVISTAFRLPVLRQVNGVLGAVAGVVEGVIMVFLAVAVIGLIAASSGSNGKITRKTVDDTIIVHVIENANPVTDALGSLTSAS